MLILRVLESLETIETKIADLYELFSKIFAEDAGAASFFYRMSVDETAHANLVRYQRRVVVQNMKLVKEISLDLDAVNATLERVISVLSEPPYSLEEALKIALEIEKSLAEAHSLTAVAQAIPDFSRLLSSLSGFDSRHCEVVEDFAASRGFPFEATKGRRAVMHATLSAPDTKTGESPFEIPPEMLERIEHYFKWHESMDLYEVLGIRDYATNDDIKRAYHSKAHEFHPDSYVNAPEEIQKKLGVIFSSLTEAYSTLTDPVKRRQYDEGRTNQRK